MHHRLLLSLSGAVAGLANGLFGIRKYPHTDKADIAYLAMKTLAKVMRGELTIETKIVHLPLLIPISAGMTDKPQSINLSRLLSTNARLSAAAQNCSA